MKRFISFILVFTLCISCMSIFVSASSFDPDNTSYFNLLDYGVSSSGSNFIVVNGNTVAVSYNTPYVTTLTYVDMVVTTLSAGLTSVYAGRAGYAIDSGVKKQLTVIPLNDRCYRIYGSIFATDYSSIEFNFFTDSSSRSYINVQSLIAYDSRYDSYNDTGTLLIGDVNSAQNYTYVQDFYGDTVSHKVSAMTNGTTDQGNTRAYLMINNWKKYDRVEFCGTISSSDINSVIALGPGSISLPYDITYLGDPVNEPDGSAYATRNYVMSIDLTGVDRTSSADTVYLCLELSFPWNKGCFITLDFVHGFVKQSDIATDYYFYQKIIEKVELFRTNFFTVLGSLQTNLQTWFNDLGSFLGNLLTTLNNNLVAGLTNIATKLNTLISGSDEQQENASDFNDSVTDQSSELEEMTGIMDSVEKPDVGDINMDLSGMVDPTVITVATTGIGSLLSNQIILRVLLLSFTFGLIGFILYGKK